MPVGTGLVSGAVDWLHIVAAVLLVGGLVLAFVVLVWRRRRPSAVITAAIGCIALVAGAALAAQPGPAFGDAFGIPLGSTSDGPDDNIVITVGPRQTFVLTVLITNNGVVPARILGVVTPQVDSPLFPDWQFVSYANDTNAGLLPVDGQPVLEPFDLEPGKYAQLNLTGLTDGCAAGATGSNAGETMDSIRLAYDVFGLQSATDIKLRQTITEPLQANCALL